MNSLCILNGPNLNLLGARESSIYGNKTLVELNKDLQQQAQQLNLELYCKQTNSEAEFIKIIHNNQTDAMLINAAAYTHTSIAIRDALLARNTLFIEIHITNLAKREQFRHNSYLTDIALGSIIGFGIMGYSLGLTAISNYFNNRD